MAGVTEAGMDVDVNENESLVYCLQENNGSLPSKLKFSLSKTIDKYLHGAKYSILAKHLEPINKKYPGELKLAHAQFLSTLESEIKKETELMYKEEKINSLLNNLDLMIKEADLKQKSWRPSGNPELDLQAHRFFVLEQHKNELQKILQQENERNEIRIQKIEMRRKKLEKKVEELESSYEHYKNLNIPFSAKRQKLEESVQSLINEDKMI